MIAMIVTVVMVMGMHTAGGASVGDEPFSGFSVPFQLISMLATYQKQKIVINTATTFNIFLVFQPFTNLISLFFDVVPFRGREQQ